MVGSGPNLEESIGSQRQDHFVNLNAEGTEKLVCIPPILAFRLIFEMGVVSIDVFLVRLESMPNFHSENLVAFSLIFMAKIQQCFASNAS